MSASVGAVEMDFRARVFGLKDGDNAAFEALALDIFRYQAKHNPIYRSYLQALGVSIESAQKLAFTSIPFLPISLYRANRVQTGAWEPVICFESSGTTNTRPSIHAIFDLNVYEEVAFRIFEQRYGSLSGMPILALMPNAQNRPKSALIYMLEAFMRRSGHAACGFFMHEDAKLLASIEGLSADLAPQLWGFPAALLDFAKKCPKTALADVCVVTTGGLKRDQIDVPKGDVQAALLDGLRPKCLDSEYGMTELLSQAYAGYDGYFRAPPWLRIYARDGQDPLQNLATGEVGPLNIVDLASTHSCAFIATEDLGRVLPNRSFELFGRVSSAVSRGCHLLYED